MEYAMRAAAGSTDPKTKVGAAFYRGGVLLACGCNRITEGVRRLPERMSGDAKRYYTEHGERDAIYSAAYRGVSLRDSECASTLFPCADCARAIVACGAVRLVAPRPDIDTPSKWREDWVRALEILEEAGVCVSYVNETE